MGFDVILAFPGKYGAPNPEIPLVLPYLGGALDKSEYKPKLLDMSVEKYDGVDLNNVICVGISCLTGHQILYGLEFARYIRERDPDVPIVWGGVHPSMLPEQTVENEYVDIVVRGEGELTLPELVQKIESGESVHDVRGITYMDRGQIKSAPDREFIDLNSLPIELPYHLLRLEEYPHFRRGHFNIQTSRGCPHRCAFCYNLSFNKLRYRWKGAERVLDEVEYLVDKFHLKSISFAGDDEFFVIKNRVKEICNGLIKRGIDVKWWAFCRFDDFSKYDKDFIRLLQASGCGELTFGGESASPRLLKLMQKDITPEMMIASVKKLKDFETIPIVSFMCGFPTETKEELYLTFQFMDKLTKINPKIQYNAINTYTPYPGTPLYDVIVNDFGFNSPQTLEEWSRIHHSHFHAPWFDKEYVDFLETLVALTRFVFYSKEYEIPERWNRFPYNVAYRALSFLARTRWKQRFFGFPIEWKIVGKWMRHIRGYF